MSTNRKNIQKKLNKKWLIRGIFHSPPGVLFTFPSQYYALSVTKEYLALRGGPRSFNQGFSCLDLLWIPSC